jgi:acetyl esterase/lipase
MRTPALSFPLGLAAGLLLVPPAGADEPKPVGGPPEVEAIKDVAYYDGKDADPVKHRLDLYLPKGRKDFPVLFFVHGGAWKSGDKKTYAPLGEVFARQGLGTVIINYRLSPAVKHPAHIEDVARAFAWTHAHIASYGGRADEIFAGGHSAGGHLVALLATDEKYLQAEHLALGDIKAVIAISGVYLIVPPLFSSVFGKDVATYKEASPLEHVKAGEPPFLILYGDRDFPTCDVFSKRMAEALTDAKCAASTLEIKDRDHISIIKRMLNDGDPAAHAIVEFVGKHCDRKPVSQEPK